MPVTAHMAHMAVMAVMAHTVRMVPRRRRLRLHQPRRALRTARQSLPSRLRPIRTSTITATRDIKATRVTT